MEIRCFAKVIVVKKIIQFDFPKIFLRKAREKVVDYFQKQQFGGGFGQKTPCGHLWICLKVSIIN